MAGAANLDSWNGFLRGLLLGPVGLIVIVIDIYEKRRFHSTKSATKPLLVEEASRIVVNEDYV